MTEHSIAVSHATGKLYPTQKEIKILMLHGYTQSGPLFQVKTRALEKALQKAFAALDLTVVLIYPTGPIRLSTHDIPQSEPTSLRSEARSSLASDDVEPETYAWYRLDHSLGVYWRLDEGIWAIAAAIRKADGVDGVIGFSQGAAVAGLVASVLEGDRSVPPACADWTAELRAANHGRRLRFAVSYSGYCCRVDSLRWCYNPEISTPTLHYIGSLDTVVEEERSRGLIDLCVDPQVVIHPGGHYVPIARVWVAPIVNFLKHLYLETDAILAY